jgi:phage baseplate assembly protein W
MATRADRITQLQKAPEIFSDFMSALTPHPVSHDLARIKNEQSIKQALRNIIMTGLGERPFQPYIGSDIEKSLFEMDDEIAAEAIRSAIEISIYNSEPRVSVIELIVTSFPLENKVGVNLVFSIVNSTVIQSINLILRRVR